MPYDWTQDKRLLLAIGGLFVFGIILGAALGFFGAYQSYQNSNLEMAKYICGEGNQVKSYSYLQPNKLLFNLSFKVVCETPKGSELHFYHLVNSKHVSDENGNLQRGKVLAGEGIMGMHIIEHEVN